MLATLNKFYILKKNIFKIKSRTFSNTHIQVPKYWVSIILYLMTFSGFAGILVILENQLRILETKNASLHTEIDQLHSMLNQIQQALELVNKKLEQINALPVMPEVVVQHSLPPPVPMSDQYRIFLIKLGVGILSLVIVSGVSYWVFYSLKAYAVETVYGGSVAYVKNSLNWSNPFEGVYNSSVEYVKSYFSFIREVSTSTVVEIPTKLSSFDCADMYGNKIDIIARHAGCEHNVVKVCRAGSDVWISVSDLLRLNFESLLDYTNLNTSSAASTGLSTLVDTALSTGGGSVIGTALSTGGGSVIDTVASTVAVTDSLNLGFSTEVVELAAQLAAML